MKVGMDLTISYRGGEPYAAYLTLAHPLKAKVYRTRALENEILVDFARDGQPLGIELLDPRRTTLTRLNRIMRRLRLPPLRQEMVRPLMTMSAVLRMIRHHHERFDGRGYPDGLAGEEIPLAARVFAVADSFDAMTSHRPYRGPMGIDRALGEIAGHAGTQFDPKVVRVFVAMIEEDPPTDDEDFLAALAHAS